MRDLKDHYINPHERGSPDFTIQYSKLTPIMQAEYRIAKQLRKTLHLDCEDNMKWIECTKRLPKNEEECLVAFCIMPGDPECGLCYNLSTYVHGVFHSWELGNTINHVTHWMPLPKGPDQ